MFVGGTGPLGTAQRARVLLILCALFSACQASALTLDDQCESCRSGLPPGGAAPAVAPPEPLLLKRDNDCVACATVTPAALTPASVETFVSLTVNLQPRGDVLVLLAQDGEVLMREDDFKALDVKRVSYTPSVIDGVAYVGLRNVPGLQVSFDLAKLELRLQFDPRILSSNRIVDLAPQRRRDVIYPPPGGSFLNYNFTASGADSTGLAALGFAGEAGWRMRDWLFLTDGFVTDDRTANRVEARRLSSSLTREDRDTLQRTVLGDFITTPISPLGSSLRLGGISVSKRYTLDPYIVRFPGQIVTGTATLPSEVFLYSNGVLIRREAVPPGAFELRNIINTPGLNVTDVVIRDVLGNEQHIVNPYYFTDQLLRPGYAEYSFDAGVERRQFGVRNADYGGPGLSAFYRRGLSDALTLGARGEALGGRYSAGPVATFGAGTLGVVSAALSAGSGPQGSGYALALGHSYQRPAFFSSLAYRAEGRTYPFAGSDAAAPVKSDIAGALGFAYGPTDSWSFNFADTRGWDDSRSASTGVTYRRRLSSDAYLSVGARHASAPVSLNEVIIGVTFTFDAGNQQPTMTLQARRTGGVSDQLAQIAGAPKGSDEGLYYRATLEQATNGAEPRTQTVNSFMQYNFAKASARAEYNRELGSNSGLYNLSASGAVAQVDGTWGASRSITDSFGVVKVGDLPGIRVYSNNIEAGRTDESGKIFVPRLASSFENAVSIDDRDLPIEYIVPQTRYYIVPATRSGVLVEFPARRVQAVAGKLVLGGAPFGDAEGELRVEDRALPLYASRDGSFYLEDVGPGRYSGVARRTGQTCGFTIEVPKSTLPVVELGKVSCDEKPR